MIKIETKVEGALIQDGTKSHHGAIRLGVTALKRELRRPSGLGLRDQGISGGGALQGKPSIRIIPQRGREGAIDRPWFG
jgi:hypothetical protein